MGTGRPLSGQLAFLGLAVTGLVLLAASAVVAGGAGAAHALTNCEVGDYSLDGEELGFLALINDYRAQNGLGALTISTNLNRAAHWMSNDLGTNNYFSHTDSLGRSPYARAIDCGYPQGAGENLAAGTAWSSAQAAFDAWKASPGHNANMLSQYYLQIGIARVNVPGSNYGWYWTTNFGSTDDGSGGGGSPAPTATPTSTPAPPTATPTNTAVPPATNTPAAQPTGTATPGNGGAQPPSATPTATVKPPTATPTPAGLQPKSPGATPTPTRTPTPVPTSAPKTPTPSSGSLPLKPGANLVGWPGGNMDAHDALESLAGVVAVVYRWDDDTGTWQRYAPGSPPYVNSLLRVVQGEAYWVITK
jgi:uncharacterized protein YkwD